MGFFKKKEKTKITEKEKVYLLYTILEDIQKNYDIITINSQMTKVKEILNDLGIHKEVINCNKEKLSDELVQSIYDYCNYPSKVLNKFMYKQWKKIFDKLQKPYKASYTYII